MLGGIRKGRGGIKCEQLESVEVGAEVSEREREGFAL